MEAVEVPLVVAVVVAGHTHSEPAQRARAGTHGEWAGQAGVRRVISARAGRQRTCWQGLAPLAGPLTPRSVATHRWGSSRWQVRCWPGCRRWAHSRQQPWGGVQAAQLLSVRIIQARGLSVAQGRAGPLYRQQAAAAAAHTHTLLQQSLDRLLGGDGAGLLRDHSLALDHHHLEGAAVVQPAREE